jgi:hypothetical protein
MSTHILIFMPKDVSRAREQWERESKDTETRETMVEIADNKYIVKRETVRSVYADGAQTQRVTTVTQKCNESP